MAFSVAMRKLSEITFVLKEMARQQKERSERERQRAEQERRKEKEEEDALEQVFILIIRPNYFFKCVSYSWTFQARIALAGGSRPRSAAPAQAPSPPPPRY